MELKDVPLNTVLAWIGWALAGVVAVAGLVFELHAAGLAIMLSGAAGTLHVRGMIARLDQRDKVMFDLGRTASGMRRVE